MATMPPQPNKAFRISRRDVLVLALLLLLLTLVLWPVLFAAGERAPGLSEFNGQLQDGRTQWYPWRVYGFRSMREGTLPLWNPYVLCGVPFVGNFQSALFYPPNAIFLVAPVGTAARWSIWFHLALSLVFTYLFAKFCGCSRAGASVAAMAFTFCAGQLLRVPAGHWGVSCAIPWLVLVLLCTEWLMRGPSLAAVFIGGVAVGLQILSGMPQYVFITVLAVGVFAVIRSIGTGLPWRGRLLRWAFVAGMLALGAAVGAIQLMPGIEAAAHGARSLPMRQAWLDQFSLGPECLLTLLIPGFFGGAEGGAYWGRFLYWEMTAYVGVAAFALALYAAIWGRPRRRIAWVGVLGLVMLLLALGRNVGLIHLLRAVVPFGGSFRGAAKFLLPFSLALSLLAGLGLDAVFRKEEKTLGRGIMLIGVLAGVVVILVLLGAFRGGPLTAFRDYVASTGEVLDSATPVSSGRALGDPIVSGGVFALVVLGLMGLLRYLFDCSRRVATRNVLVAVAVFVVAADMFYFGRLFVGPEATFEAADHAWPQAVARSLSVDDGKYRAVVAGLPTLNDGMVEKVPTVEGIEPNPPARFHVLFRRGQDPEGTLMPVDVAPSLYQVHRRVRALRLTALGRIMVPQDSNLQMPGGEVSRSGKGWQLLDVADKLPRAFVVHEAQVAHTPSEAFEQTLAVNPELTVVLEEESKPASGSSGVVTSSAQIAADLPNRVAVSVKLKAPGWLVLLDNYFPGWHAEVDGRPAKILRANFAFRAVALAGGTHDVVFRYRPGSFTLGMAVTCLALGACVVFAIVRLVGRLRSSCCGK